MPSITRKLEFDAGHRILGHEGKCRHLHGHRYVAEILVSGRDLDDIGRVVDFGFIKETVGGWIDEHWDHNIILHPDDPLLEATVNTAAGLSAEPIFGGKLPFIMPRETPNPTAENMAAVLAKVAQSTMPSNVYVHEVRIYETPNCWADWRL